MKIRLNFDIWFNVFDALLCGQWQYLALIILNWQNSPTVAYVILSSNYRRISDAGMTDAQELYSPRMKELRVCYSNCKFLDKFFH